MSENKKRNPLAYEQKLLANMRRHLERHAETLLTRAMVLILKLRQDNRQLRKRNKLLSDHLERVSLPETQNPDPPKTGTLVATTDLSSHKFAS